MVIRHVLVGVLLLAPAPAHAEPVADVHGLTCGLTASHDGTGMIYGEAHAVDGIVTGGPLAVHTSEPVLHTRVVCEVVEGSTTRRVRSATAGGPAVVLSEPIFFLAARDARISLCTRVEWLTPSGSAARDLGCVHAIDSGVQLLVAGEYTVVPTAV